MRSQILAVQKMQDYIEAHLTEEITLAALADICNFPPGMPIGCFGSIPVTLQQSISVGCGWRSLLCA